MVPWISPLKSSCMGSWDSSPDAVNGHLRGVSNRLVHPGPEAFDGQEI